MKKLILLLSISCSLFAMDDIYQDLAYQGVVFGNDEQINRELCATLTMLLNNTPNTQTALQSDHCVIKADFFDPEIARITAQMSADLQEFSQNFMKKLPKVDNQFITFGPTGIKAIRNYNFVLEGLRFVFRKLDYKFDYLLSIINAPHDSVEVYGYKFPYDAKLPGKITDLKDLITFLLEKCIEQREQAIASHEKYVVGFNRLSADEAKVYQEYTREEMYEHFDRLYQYEVIYAQYSYLHVALVFAMTALSQKQEALNASLYL